jgi:lipoate-protein ligase A
MQMALDEALFRHAGESGDAIARFYGWDEPATTFGYFTPAGEMAAAGAIRRYTGGGKVEHGDDLTFLLAIPAGAEAARFSSGDRYHWIHSALAEALCQSGLPAGLETQTLHTAPGPCFQNPVTWDLLDTESGRKIGGGAQRRTRRGVIHQGSLRLPAEFRDLHSGWLDLFLGRLSDRSLPLPETEKTNALETARELEISRYRTQEWNGRR